MSDPSETADAILMLARQLVASLRAGTATLTVAHELESTIREAQGWLISAREYLDPENTLSRGPVLNTGGDW